MLRKEKTKDVRGESEQARLGAPNRRHAYTKALALALSALTLALVFVSFDPKTVGLYRETTTSYPSCIHYGRFFYSFFHASVIHWLLNAWCFLSCVFLADVSFRKLLLAYLTACSAPVLSATPTIGLSGVCFALLGMVMWQSADRRAYNIITGATVLVTFVLCPKAVNNALHVYCYLLGVASVPFFNRLRRLTHNL